jgi:hypothetical protein
MKKYPEISLTGMCRRAVIARYRTLDDDTSPTKTEEEIAAKVRLQKQTDAAIEADPDVNTGGEIEEALNAAFEEAISRGAKGADALAAAAVTDPRVLKAINRPGAAAVILRQLIGYVFKLRESDDDEDEPLTTVIADRELLRRLAG